MTKDELKEVIKSNVHAWHNYDAVLAAVDAYSSALLQQTACYTALELLQQMLNEEQIAYMQSENSMEADMRLYNEDALKAVIKLINARQANGV